MAKVMANGLELEYETLGDGEPMVLIMGIGAPGVFWDDGFCSLLVERGYRVIRFDHRDVGLSTRLDHLGRPRLARVVLRRALRRPNPAPYTLRDMADDVAGLLDGLDIEAAHLVGTSMGGMVAQQVAVSHPSRVRSLTSMMSTTGSLRVTVGKPRALRALMGPRPQDREQAMDQAAKLFRVIGTPPYDDERARRRAAAAWDRGFYQPGFARHLAAVLASGDRTASLGQIRAPTLVIHGSEDPLIRPRAGEATAAAIPGAKLLRIDGMGHDFATRYWPTLIDAIDDHAASA